MAHIIASLVLAVPLFASSAAWAADDLPPPVAAAVAEAKKVCGSAPAKLKPLFLERQDVNGDGVQDFIVNHDGVRCGDNDTSPCNTKGCVIQVFASSKGGFAEVLNIVAQDLDFHDINGRPAVVVDDTGLNCGPSGKDPCGTIFLWNGTRFSPPR